MAMASCYIIARKARIKASYGKFPNGVCSRTETKASTLLKSYIARDDLFHALLLRQTLIADTAACVPAERGPYTDFSEPRWAAEGELCALRYYVTPISIISY
ncbi:hypothetical protein EVAR_4372_1 [Eumeta japonica]|uniref:Uncharacterized protein n=1 Tax=Eumeta variegata TaxID=151549 RepID=A0A4C1SXD8_EUMVA|nr:hypothetical protein EVAR_4372_1 [Eumeta japonica]